MDRILLAEDDKDIREMLILYTFRILQASIAMIKKSSQFVYISSLLSIILVQMMISQEMEVCVILAGGCFAYLFIMAMKKYIKQLECWFYSYKSHRLNCCAVCFSSNVCR